MKQFCLIIISLLFIVNIVVAEENYRDSDIKRIDLKKKEMPILVNGEWDWYSFDKVDAILNNDLYEFFQIRNVSTPLQKKKFEESAEYTDSIAPLFKTIRKDLLSAYYGISFNLEGNIPYNVVENRFNFRIGFPNDSRTKRPESIFFNGNLCVQLPAKNMIIRQNNIGGYYSLSQFVVTPKVPEDLALEIERGMADKNCPYSLLFVVKVEKTLEIPSMFRNDYYTICKAVGLFIYNHETNKIVVDFDDIFKVKEPTRSTSTKKTTSSAKRSTRR